MSSVYKRDRKEITKEFLRAAGTWGAFFWLLKVELIINFVQFFALFFGHIYTKALDIVKLSYGRFFAIFALDFHVVDRNVNPWTNLHVLLLLGLCIGLIALCVLPLVVRLRGFVSAVIHEFTSGFPLQTTPASTDRRTKMKNHCL